MKFEIFPSASGDCVLITSANGKTLLSDAGLPTAYDKFIAAPFAKMRNEGRSIDVAYVSHIDRDHIGGILRMLDHEMKWRVFDHMKSKGRRFKKPKVPRPPLIGEIWHNAFLETIAKTKSVQLGSMLTASAGALSALNAAALGNPEQAALAAKTEMLALSVGDAIEVNWRIGADQLDIPLNPDFDGEFMVARPDQPIQLGSMTVTVLGPTAKQLRELRKEWVAWLKKSKDYVKKLRKQHDRDIDDLRTGMAPLDIARRTRDMVLAVEKDVTPPNLASLVLLVEENGKRALLTGDAGDESLLEYLKKADLLDQHGRIEIDVLKVPHHGAHNSFSADFVERVRARNYIFCGDGEHHNPEPDVVAGYLKAVKKAPLVGAGDINFWFNWSKARATKHESLWEKVEGMFKPGKAPPGVKRRSIRKNQRKLVLDLG